jgi:hypothetical protein
MRTLRSQLVSVYSFLGIISVFAILLTLTGFLLGIITPKVLTAALSLIATKISTSILLCWLIALIGWYLAVWTTSFIMKHRFLSPIPVSEDDKGAVEIAPEALCSLAKNELKSHGISGPSKTDFTRKFGSPMLQVWCDLACGESGESPVELGNILKRDIESRLREDFNLNGIRVAVIHQPNSNNRRKLSTKPAT